MCKRGVAVLLVALFFVSTFVPIPTYATDLSESEELEIVEPKSEPVYSIEILPAEDNVYIGNTEIKFNVKISYKGTESIPKESLFLKSAFSSTEISTENEQELSAVRTNVSDLREDNVWKEEFTFSLPALEKVIETDYLVVLMDKDENAITSSNYSFTVATAEPDSIEEDTEKDVFYETTDSENDIQVESMQTGLRNYYEIADSLLKYNLTLEQLYYGSVEKDATAPFHNAAELKEILENGEEEYARLVWQTYQYDLWDPNFHLGKGGCGSLYTPSGSKKPRPGDRPDYADELLESTGHEYPKDGKTPFHENPEAEIIPVDNATLVDGVLIGNDKFSFENLSKTATPDIGDENTNREYTVDLKATANLEQTKPIVFVFQFQTSFQMFDLLHANSRASLVNGEKINTDLLSLYDMKHGFLEFVDWVEEYSKGSVMIGVTNFQHGGSYSMIGAPYYTNNPETIRNGLYGWDSFGDCEHIHYSRKALDNAIAELNNSSNFTNWTDAEGNSIYQDAEIVSVIVGGACETKDLKYGNLLPAVDGKNKLKKQYGIRTNTGTIDKISWMDYEAEGKGKKGDEGGKFDTGKYYPGVTTREDFVHTLQDIYYDAQQGQSISDVLLEDTITGEFSVKESEIKAFVGGKEVTDEVKITVEEQKDGTTKVTCQYPKVMNYEEVELQIPVQAKEDFIGSNNVKTNSGTPTISHPGRIDPDQTFSGEFTDKPAVNVPIRFMLENGETITLSPGQEIDLSELARDEDGIGLITKKFEELLGKYGQTEGTVTYQWVDEKGNPLGDPTSSFVSGKNQNPPELPSYVVTGKEEDIGKKFTYRLKVTFTPEAVKEETTSKIPVSERTEYGDVGIEVIQKPVGKIRIQKVIDNYSEFSSRLLEDDFMIQIQSESGTPISTEVVLKHDETSGYIEVQEDSWIHINEIIPMEYEFSGITIEGEGAEKDDIQGTSVKVQRGDDITITVHNKYQWKPFFHGFDTIKNLFSWDK